MYVKDRKKEKQKERERKKEVKKVWMTHLKIILSGKGTFTNICERVRPINRS